MFYFIFFFFFSSRRRHTRLQGDWSSDVCSSDLDIEALDLQAVQQVSGVLVREVGELRLGAALRYVPIHFGRELAERREILGGGRERQQHLARPNLERQVAPHQKRRQDRSFRLGLGVLEEPM